MPDENSTYFNHDTQEMIAMSSHELGVHLLLTCLQDKVQESEISFPKVGRLGIYGLVSYMALESLVAFYNELISEDRLLVQH